MTLPRFGIAARVSRPRSGTPGQQAPPVLVVDTPYGTARHVLRLDGDAGGRELFDTLLGADLWERIVRDHPGGVELALDLPLELQDRLWESMHDGQRPLGADPGRLVAITRRVPTDAELPGPVSGAPRVLFASGARLTDQVVLPGAMFLGLLRECESD
ncbi:MAG: hypothetical protein HOY71_48915, partial [Nonomuraea sp.]|nr:hypothetical protein [Nonomuraea sp.]